MQLPVLAEKPALHQSQLGMIYSCPMKYFYRYVEGIKTHPGIALITGTSTHASVESNLRNKMTTGALLDEQTVMDVARDKVNQVWDAEGVQLDAEEREEGEKIIRGRTVDASLFREAVP